MRLLCPQPSQRQHVSEGARHGLIPLPGCRQVGIDGIVKDEVAVVQRIRVAVKAYRAVLDEESGCIRVALLGYRRWMVWLVMIRPSDSLMSGLETFTKRGRPTTSQE